MKHILYTLKKSNRSLTSKAKVLMVFLLFVGSYTASAQIGLPNGGDANIPDAPIDGFLTLSLIAGALIGLRKRVKDLKE